MQSRAKGRSTQPPAGGAALHQAAVPTAMLRRQQRGTAPKRPRVTRGWPDPGGHCCLWPHRLGGKRCSWVQDLALPRAGGGVSPHQLGCPHGGDSRHGVPMGQDAREWGEAAEQGEEPMPAQGWGTGRPLQGETKPGATSGVAGGDPAVPSSAPVAGSPPPAAHPPARAVPRWGVFPGGFGVRGSPHLASWQRAAHNGGSPLPSSGATREWKVPWLPGPRATMGCRH